MPGTGWRICAAVATGGAQLQMAYQLLGGALVSLLNFCIHGLVTVAIVAVTPSCPNNPPR